MHPHQPHGMLEMRCTESSALWSAESRGMGQAEAGAAAEPQRRALDQAAAPGLPRAPAPSWLIGPLSRLRVFSPF